MKRTCFLLLVLTSFFMTVEAFGQARSSQTAGSNKVDEYVKAEMQRERIPGLALVVIHNGKIVKEQGYGFANVEDRAPVKPETIFESGSIGKQFTATAVMMLVEQGKLSLDDKINKYLTDAPESWNDITIRRLLSHTAGLGGYPPNLDLRKDYTEDELLKILYAAPLSYKPGESWSYSNSGYITLGILVHKISGQFYGDFLHDNVFKPLGMDYTRIISESDIIPNRAAGYTLVKGELKNQEWVSPSLNSTADGSLYFNVVDLAKWDAALYTEKLLKKSDLELMWTPVKLNNGSPNSGKYGFGWFRNEANGHLLIEHGGAWQGFTTDISRYVNDHLTVIVLTNLASNAGSNPTKIAHNVAGFYLPALKPVEPRPIPDKEPQVTAALRGEVDKLVNGTASPDDFTGDAKAQFSAENLKTMNEQLKNWGAVKTFDLMKRSDAEGKRVYTYRVVFQYGPTLGLVFALGPDNKIAQLRFEMD